MKITKKMEVTAPALPVYSTRVRDMHFFLQALFMCTDHLEWSDGFVCGEPLNLPIAELEQKHTARVNPAS